MTPPFLPLQRAKRCWVLLLLLGVLISAELVTMVAAVDAEEECNNPNKVRLVTQEELAMKKGLDGSDIWLSILGEVYDVTSGEQFYGGGGGGYGIFAGRDASVAFITGQFNDEEAKKGLDSLSIKSLSALEHWRDFYEKSDKYHFIGLLVDPRYYDEEGKPTPALLEYREREETFKEMQSQFHEDEKQRAEDGKEKRSAAKA